MPFKQHCFKGEGVLYFSYSENYRKCSKTFGRHCWPAGIACGPGFLRKPLLCISDLFEDGQKDCLLIIDEMSMKKEIRWDPKNQQFEGTVDYGNIKAKNPDKIATNVLLSITASLKNLSISH